MLLPSPCTLLFQTWKIRTPMWECCSWTIVQVNSFKFLGVHITEDLTWSAHTDAVLKKAHQRLFFLRRLRTFGTSSLRSFYTCTVESILTGCIIGIAFSLRLSGYQANEQQKLIHPTAHSHFTICYAMHCTLTWTLTQFNWTTHTHCTNTTTYLLPLDTIQCTSMTLRIRHMYNLLHLFSHIIVCIFVHNVECVHIVYNVYW